MDRQIPIYFDSVIVDSPIERISASNPNLGRLKVRVFTKYGNRNGSYITEAVANQLIDSIYERPTPVVGFFDPETQSWASHTGPLLANSYGYVRDFLGWETYTDTDGVAREYAVFSVDMFIGYYEEAQKVLGQNQSMELDPATITGDWALIENQEYYVYKTAKMLGFCIIGDHEPCFSVSAFFSKNDTEYKNQYEKFSSLLADLKAQVEEAESSNNGGEQPMEQQNEFAVVEELPVEEVTAEAVVQPEESGVDTFEEVEQQEEVEENTPSEFEVLTQQFNELQNNYNELQANFDNAQNRVNELEVSLANAAMENANLQNQLNQYAAQVAEAELAHKNSLIEKYTNILSEEEIAPISQSVNDLSYEEIESKLAIVYANKVLAQNDTQIQKVLIPEQPKDQFALLMEKYHK